MLDEASRQFLIAAIPLMSIPAIGLAYAAYTFARDWWLDRDGVGNEMVDGYGKYINE